MTGPSGKVGMSSCGSVPGPGSNESVNRIESIAVIWRLGLAQSDPKGMNMCHLIGLLIPLAIDK